MLAVDAISFVLFSASVAEAYLFSLGGAIKIIRLFRVYGTTILIPFVGLITLFLTRFLPLVLSYLLPAFIFRSLFAYFWEPNRGVELH